jgi:hypothetical protein
LQILRPNDVNKNALPRSYALLLIVIALLAVMSARSPISSFVPAEAYASENISYLEKILQANIESGMQGENRNRLGGGITTTNGIDQGSFQSGTNINEDNDVVVGRCDDGHIQVNDEDEVTQTTMSSANQEGIDDNEVNLGDKVANNPVQALTQIATNVNIDNDLVIILGCQSGSIEINDNDKVTQSHLQSTNQEANDDNEEEEDNE